MTDNKTPAEIKADGSMDSDFAFHQTGTIYAIFQDNPFWEARLIIAHTLRGYHNRIAALEVQLERAKNPPYRVETGIETLGDAIDSGDCWWAIYHGDTLVLEEWGHDTEESARIEGERILSRLTAPLGAKGE